jgi:hypothetical protein
MRLSTLPYEVVTQSLSIEIDYALIQYAIAYSTSDYALIVTLRDLLQQRGKNCRISRKIRVFQGPKIPVNIFTHQKHG